MVNLQWAARPALVGGIVVVALMLNAVIFGVLIGPSARYQERLSWLATYVVLLVICQWLVSQVAGRSSEPPPKSG